MDTMFTRSTPPKVAAMSDQQDGAHHRGWRTLPQLDTRAPADKMPPAAPRRRPLLNGPAEPYHTPVFFLFPLFYSTLSLVFTIYILGRTIIVFGPPE